jgi:UDP-N-acetylmuramate dehydrogenase
MPSAPALTREIVSIPGATVTPDVSLSRYTRFGIGGPAALVAEIDNEAGFIQAIGHVRESGSPFVIIGDGTNLIVSDSGYAGAVLRFTLAQVSADRNRVTVTAGATLQQLVDFTIARGLAGLHVMTGIPGSAGAAIYGNAGAYGRSIAQSVRAVRFYDGNEIRTISNGGCEFRYRESIFKRHKDWIILSATLELDPGESADLRSQADAILEIRNRKYPQTMKCAGSIFKNLLLDELPEPARSQVPVKSVIEGKVPSAYFLEQVGAKGMADGDIRVADYHANLIYNEGAGTALQLRRMIEELKRRVQQRFGFALEEEVQYIGF